MQPGHTRSSMSRTADGAGDLIAGRYGPIASAVVLSLISAPVAAAAIASVRVSTWDDSPALADPSLAGPMAVVAVLAAGLAGGLVGGRFVRRSPVNGLLLAVAVAWPVALATLPLLPTLRHVAFAGIEVCIDSCGHAPGVRGGDLSSGLELYLGSLLVGLIFVVPIALAVGLAVAERYAAKRDRLVLAAALGLTAVASLDCWWGVVESLTPDDVRLFGRPEVPFGNPALAFVCLVLGAIVWAVPYWTQAKRVQEPAAT